MWRPARVAADAAGRLWVTEPFRRRAVILDAGGRELEAVTEGLVAPLGLFLGRGQTNAWAADAGAGALIEITVEGGARVARVPGPRDVAVDEDAQVAYVAGSDGRIHACPLPGRPEALVELDAAAITLSADRKRLYALRRDTLEIVAVDLADHTVTSVVAGPGPATGEPAAADLALGPGGLVTVDARSRSLRGINLQHGTATTIWRGELRAPCGVTHDRTGRSYIVCDPAAGHLVRIAADGSGATVLAGGTIPH
jgi:DNA-binding beta-propeller fold protein YncE